MALFRLYESLSRFNRFEEIRNTDLPATPRTEIVVRKTLIVIPKKKGKTPKVK